MSKFKKYKRKQISELRPVTQNDLDYYNTHKFLLSHPQSSDSMIKISISDADIEKGSPKLGDMIARNPDDHIDQWLVEETYFNDNFEEL